MAVVCESTKLYEDKEELESQKAQEVLELHKELSCMKEKQQKLLQFQKDHHAAMSTLRRQKAKLRQDEMKLRQEENDLTDAAEANRLSFVFQLQEAEEEKRAAHAAWADALDQIQTKDISQGELLQMFQNYFVKSDYSEAEGAVAKNNSLMIPKANELLP